MMNKDFYQQIFRRKSFHTYAERTDEHISDQEIEEIYNAYKTFDSLKEIKTAIKIVKTEETNCDRNAEYCIMMFSEKKDGYRQNIGYLGEQLDLYLVSKNIGPLWFGIAKQDDVYEGLDYVIMIAIAKVSGFRKDMFKAKRKEINEIWDGDDLGIANIVRFAPSAINSQPWFVENKNNQLFVYRYSKPLRPDIYVKNEIDIGIFMCFLDLCLYNEGYTFERTLYKDNDRLDIKELNAVYSLKKN